MKRKTRGFSILEVLISFTVLTVAILALLGIIPAAARQGSSSSMQSQALYRAQIAMDDALRRATFNDSGTAAGWDSTSFVRWWTEPGPNTRTQVMHVEVTWVEGGETWGGGVGRSRRVELQSMIYQ
ncbi:MAG: prepilin-type N-terminal cleavage/methylation domain-containing protein [Candidatus Eremiobacterota bacterium]